MYLKQLDIIGFKSFAEKITIEFVPGVTAVVGPNGSGKSNITDAIRWVLGEQSAKSLRGGKMEDIIFAGSDSRKPLNFAEVALTLNNEDEALPIDYNEVCVARRVFRSGESEYLLNGQGCRLKDIIDLFMDSGLGKEAFSIISQGKVEEILNSKPEERRTIFEEAAGVLKYKTRKKKAEGKLQETSDNLNRVNDILHELESQIEPLKIQASIAKDYLEKKKELENHEVALTVHEIGVLHENWETSKQELHKLSFQEKECSTKIQANESKTEKERNKLALYDETIANLQSELLTATKDLEKLEGRREVLKERKRNATQNTEQLKKNIDDATLKVSQITEKRNATKKEVSLKETEVQTLQKELEVKRKQLSQLDDTIEDTIESLKSDYIEVLNEQASAKNEMQYLDQQLNQQMARSNRLDGENEKFIEERSNIAEQLEKKMEEMHLLEKEIAEQLIQYNETKKNIESLSQHLEKQTSMLNQANQFIQKAQSRKEALEEMEDDYTGFFQGVKEVLKAKDNILQGIEGAILELIQVPKEYAKAVEIALGGSMQNIVVKTEKDAREAIQFLKRKQYGRATFLPLNTIREKGISSNQEIMVSSHPSFIGIASKLVKFKDEHAAAVNSLLGNIIVARDLAGANQIAKILQHRYRIVSLEGDVVNPGGSMTGGASKQSTGSLLGRKSELEDLKEKLVEMREKTAILQDSWEKARNNLTNEEKLLELIRSKGEQLRIKQNDVESTLAQIKINKKNVDDRLAVYDLETSELKVEKNKINDRIKALSGIISTCEGKIHSLNERIKRLTAQRNNERQSKDSLAKEITELSSLLAVSREQLSSTRNAFHSLNNELTELETRKNSLVEDLQWLESEMTGHSSTEGDLVEEAIRKKADKEEIEQNLSAQREERLQLQISIEQREAELKEFNRIYNGITVMLKNEEVKSNRLDVELDNLLNKLREEYSLSYERAKEIYTLTLPVEETRTKVKLIKIEIAELGTVNMGAIEEYERVSERYHFLKEQQTDLTDAKDHLFQVMDEMDSEMEKRFSTTFFDIQSEFEGVFKALFGGGRAELTLTNPEDMLNTGVDIVAQPPGKKLQNLSLLSGGERSLTAIALLFSILKIRPVPFCVLDEVEAALDEANVQRFSHYLKEFSKETQFIVITHRQGTMQGADVLYGVTMQESGVSKIVSVKLKKTNEMVQI
ncbi:chromosome segregation protein SMC [Lederbergia wuyishanensis]|uniref:Chromosome partition protein Smc n=1 Tax=Lederbergia wuyishanensis TaxID=1347903 RepID=A0ABU0CZM5_9BACI|nr:chromosome segregation protein SMC [Lederbergia wuyishanensis]MCJ8006235.1 chromosome segregation protein SMC [Lederbergia wuyishanensis]MDQ0341604.1 chromosome segregation protein [Lederbergia wuyishanensis]